jgi:hypothetical protein
MILKNGGFILFKVYKNDCYKIPTFGASCGMDLVQFFAFNSLTVDV